MKTHYLTPKSSMVVIAAIVLIFIHACTQQEDLTDLTISDPAALSSNSVKLGISNVSAERSQSPNVPVNVLDQNLNTRWSGQGNPTDFYIDLGATSLVDYMKIAFHKGNERTASFEVFVRQSTANSWQKINSKTSSGTTNSLQTFDLSNRDARYIRLKCKGNSQSDWNSISEIEVWGTPSSGGGGNPGTGNSPGDVLGLTSSKWKLNGFTGSPGPNATYRDNVLSATGKNFGNYEDQNYFYTDGTGTYFKCYRGLGTSTNSSNPRVELREMSNGNLASWNGSSGTHEMTWTVRVDRLPRSTNGNSGVLCFGQIHGPSPNSDGVDVDDVIRVQFLGDPDQTSGGVRMKISGYITEEVQGGSKIIDRGYQLDTEYTFTIRYSGGIVRLFEGSTQIFSQAMDTSTEGNYFKAGNYLQSVKNASYTGSYGLVRIRNISISH
ncbi:MAG: polysaccharide lyase family 7 protein [Bacteroidota bacterium]